MQEKTEKPSQRKLKKAREKGDVPYSKELTSALILLGGLLLLWTFSARLNQGLQRCFKVIFLGLNTLEPVEALKHILNGLLGPVVFLMMALVVIGVAAHFLQTGWVWGWRKGAEKSPFVLPPLKVGGVGVIGYFSLRKMVTSPPASFIHALFFILLKVALILVLIGVGDLGYQKWRYWRRHRMTRQEIKEEKREMEGDARIKSRFRKK